MATQSNNNVLNPLFTTDAMARVFSEQQRLQGMLVFEAALVRAQASVGMVPLAVVAVIEAQCQIVQFDWVDIAQGTAQAGNPAIPLIKQLTAKVAAVDVDAAAFVHFGATSQDAMDTGLVLQLRSALDLIDRDLQRLADILAQLATSHKHSVMAGRTWLQQALPITFGLKAAGWLSVIERQRARQQELRGRLLVLQCGGAAGTLAALGPQGLEIVAALAAELGLSLPDLPWHTQRDRLVEVATSFGLLVGSLGKMARDISLLMQSEVGEAFEPNAPGRGGSSAMPHKRNPVGCAVVLSAATRMPALVSTMLAAMVQEHERGLGDWHAEWETLPEICRLTAGALARMTELMEGLEVDTARMRANLEITNGLIFAETVTMALAPYLGRPLAYQMVEQACRSAVDGKQHLREVLEKDAQVQAHLSSAQLDALFDPTQAVGLAAELVERTLRRHQEKT
ncbi:MAG: 3-carboxy-cis,cis-muconate cycloisomerase [Gammaproteobacteria bacterium]